MIVDSIEIALPRPLPRVLAVGAFLKNTICLIEGQRAIVSGTVGNLDGKQAVEHFHEVLAQLIADGQPQAIAHDLHPDFYSTRYAQGSGLPTVAVQHHHAHIAALAAEHGVESPIVGLSFDGFGLGPDNDAWGGELLLVDGPEYTRLGHLQTLVQPGGDVAAREPWRMAAAALHRLGRGDEIARRFAAQPASAFLAQVIDKRLNCPETSSAGRLFDAACGLLGVHLVAEFEGQAPMALEAMVTDPCVLADGWTVKDGVLGFLPLLEQLIDCPAEQGANLFHGTLVAALTDWAADAARTCGTDVIGLGGGCFLNKVLSKGLVENLGERGFTVLTAQAVSPGDQGLSLGQAWIAALAAQAGL